MAIYSIGNETQELYFPLNHSTNWQEMRETSDINASAYASGNITYIHNGAVIETINANQFLILIPSFIYTILLMILGIPGNFIVIVVYLLKMARTTSRHFIISLAVCDFLNCSFGMPVELSLLANYYRFDFPILCKVSRCSTFFLNNTSSFVLLGIAVDRFRRVCLPLRPNMTVKHSKIICIVAGIFSMGSALPAFFIYGTKTIYIPGPTNYTYFVLKTCYINDYVGTRYPMIFHLYVFIGTLTILFALAIMYAFVGRVVCKRKTFSEEALMSRPSCVPDPDVNIQKGRTLSITSRFWKSVQDISPKLLRREKVGGNKHSLNANGLPDILEPNAIRNRTVSDASVRRHGGKSVRAGRTTLILFLVTLLFILTFVPYLVIAVMRYINPHMVEDMDSVELSVYNLMLRSYLMNSALNPLIYCFLNRQFRMKVKKLFTSFLKCRK